MNEKNLLMPTVNKELKFVLLVQVRLNVDAGMQGLNRRSLKYVEAKSLWQAKVRSREDG